MPFYNVYFIDEKANPFGEHPPVRLVMRKIKADSKKELRAFFEEIKKAHPRRFKNLKIGEIKKVRDPTRLKRHAPDRKV